MYKALNGADDREVGQVNCAGGSIRIMNTLLTCTGCCTTSYLVFDF